MSPKDECIRDFGVNVPNVEAIILEHDGIKEIMTKHDAEIYADTGDICIKCKHFNCVCDNDG